MKAEPSKTAKRIGAGVSIGCLGLTLVFAVWAYRACDRFDAAATKDRAHEQQFGSVSGARIACEQFVRERLKAPSTAKVTERGWQQRNDSTYEVSGFVDAQNSFGAMLRSDFDCRVRHVSGDRYSAVSVEMSPR